MKLTWVAFVALNAILVAGMNETCVSSRESCCMRVWSDLKRTLSIKTDHVVAFTSISLSDPSGSPLINSDVDFNSVAVVIGTADSQTTCLVNPEASYDAPAGFDKRKLFCLSIGTLIRVSVSQLVDKMPARPNSLVVRFCTADQINDVAPTVLLATAPLKCFVNSEMGVTLVDAAQHLQMNSIEIPISRARCMSHSHTCTGTVDGHCGMYDAPGRSKIIFAIADQEHCDAMATMPGMYRSLVCCASSGCNLQLKTATLLPTSPPTACQVIGVRVYTAISAIGASSNCDLAGNCFNMTASQMKAYIGTPYMDNLEPNHFSCIDGRHDNEIVATPAGDMGIFLSNAFVYINSSPAPTDFSLARIKGLLKDFILRFRTKTTRFYYHTDHHASERVIQKLEAEHVDAGEDVDNYCSSEYTPPTSARDRLLELLSDPAVGIGCGHIKYMAQKPNDYGISSAELVTSAVRALWELKWGELRDHINVEPLGHEHEEQAVLSITSITGCNGFAPLITQRNRSVDVQDPAGSDAFYSGQIFVNHDFSVKAIRSKVAEYYTAMPMAQPRTPAQFRADVDQLADGVQLMASAGLLARYRPLFTASISGREYTPDYWQAGQEPAGSLMCYVSTSMGLELVDLLSGKEDMPVEGGAPRCVRYLLPCQQPGGACGSTAGRPTWVFDFATAAQCASMAAKPAEYQALMCCSGDGCNYQPVVGPTVASPGSPPAMMCQLLGVRVATAIPAINNMGNCDSAGHCYNMTAAQMKAYIGSPKFVPLEPRHFSCIDGRHDDEIVATPAGDMGIFLSNSFVFINASNAPTDFSLARVKGLLKDFILSFRSPTTRFYYHTDHHASERVLTGLENAHIDAGPDVENYLSRDYVPPEAAKAKLLELLSDPAVGIGCGHIKYMAQKPRDYGIPSADLVTNSVRALWELKWGELKDFINVEPLGHEHEEQAVLSITSINGCDGFTPLVPQRVPSNDTQDPAGSDAFYSGQIFINHDFSVKKLRDKVAEYYTRMPSLHQALTAHDFRKRVDWLADDVQLMKSASLLAAYRPLFTATVTGVPYVPDTRSRRPPRSIAFTAAAATARRVRFDPARRRTVPAPAAAA